MKEVDPLVIKKLTEHANEIVAGNYDNVKNITGMSDTVRSSPELAELAETFGMMTVKIEAREFALAQKIELLQKKNEEIRELTGIRSLMSTIFISIILLTTIYIFLLGIINDRNLAGNHLGNILRKYPVVEFLSIGVILYMVLVSKLRLKDFGVTRIGLKKSILESLAVTAVITGLLALAKLLVNHYYPGIFKEHNIISWSYFDVTYLTYFLVAPLQEFLARGAVQGILMKLLDMRYKGLISILVTTFIFGAMHVMTSLNLTMASFLMGWIWGLMYLRHNNLAGVSLSHIIVGNVSGLMGYWVFL